MSTKIDLSEVLEYIGEVESREPFDEEKHGHLFKSAGGTNNDTMTPVTKRAKAKDEIWETVQAKAEKRANKKGIRQDLAVTQILDENPEIYTQIKELDKGIHKSADKFVN